MPTDAEELDAAKLRVVRAKQELTGTVNELTSRLGPINMASNAISRVRSGAVDWVTLGIRLYRFKGTAMTVLGALAALRARNKRRHGAERHKPGEEEGVSKVANGIKNTASQARGKIRAATDAAARKAADARDTASEKAASAYAYSRDTGTRLSHRLATGIQEHPLSVVVGGIALGLVVGALLPRLRSSSEREGTPPLDLLRERASGTARDTINAIGDRLDELGINRNGAKEVLAMVREVAGDVTTHAAKAAHDVLQKTKRNN